MASFSAAVLLKTTTLLSILAMLVLPSSARCRSPPPAPAPAPAGVIRCGDCPAHCAAAVAAAGGCGKYCDPSSPNCDSCRSMVLQYCTACCRAGGGCSTALATMDCGACDYCGGRGCAGEVERACEKQPQGGACHVDEGACKGCRAGEEERCNAYCSGNCVH